MTLVRASASAQRVLDVLRARDGVPTIIQLKNGRACNAVNIAWGQDDGASEYHLTTNASPSIPGTSIDAFATDEVVTVTDPKTGERLL